MAGVGAQVSLNLFGAFDADGRCAPRDRQVEARARLLTSLARWAGALRKLRHTDNGDGERDQRFALSGEARASFVQRAYPTSILATGEP